MIVTAVWIYAGCLLGTWGLLHLGGDRHEIASLVLFGPRWLLVVPLAVLLPITAWKRRRLVLPLLVCTVILVIPVLDCRIGWNGFSSSGPPDVRVLTLNVCEDSFNQYRLAEVIRDTAADIVALQEVSHNTHFTWPSGWHVRRTGEMLVASRFAIEEHESQSMLDESMQDEDTRRPLFTSCQATLRTPDDRTLTLLNIHLPTPRPALQRSLYNAKTLWRNKTSRFAANTERRRLASEIVARLAGEAPEALIVVGDFNMPTDSSIYRRHWSWLSNAFSKSGFGLGYTKWETWHGISFGARIDHVLTGPQWRCLRCWIGPDIGSDHRPLIADLQWTGTPQSSTELSADKP